MINSPVSLSRTFGTVFIERVLDLSSESRPLPESRRAGLVKLIHTRQDEVDSLARALRKAQEIFA